MYCVYCFGIGTKAENGTETGGDANVELKSQSRKESILNCSFMGKRGFTYKSKGGIRSRLSDQEIYWTFWKGVEYWREIKYTGVRTASACLDELTITGKRS